MATYGEFIDRVTKTGSINAQIFLKEWIGLATEEKWATYKQMHLTPELVQGFAADMASYFSERLANIETEGLYALTRSDGHDFLRSVHMHATELGVDVDIRNIDVPLTISDMLIATGFAKVIDNKEHPST